MLLRFYKFPDKISGHMSLAI